MNKWIQLVSSDFSCLNIFSSGLFPACVLLWATGRTCLHWMTRRERSFFLPLQNDSVLALLEWERWWFLYTTSLSELLYLHSLSLFLTYFVHCQFKPWLIWSSIADAQCICNVFIRSHLEDVPDTTNTFAFQSLWLQARSLGPHPHPSTLRNPKILESSTFTCVWCYTLQETGRDACL